MTQVEMIIFDKRCGMISKCVSCHESVVELQYDKAIYGHISGSKVSDEEFWVSANELLPRPDFEERICGTIIENLPNPTTLRVHDELYQINDGTAELSFALPGTYQVMLSSFPYRDKKIEVTQP